MPAHRRTAVVFFDTAQHFRVELIFERFEGHAMGGKVRVLGVQMGENVRVSTLIVTQPVIRVLAHTEGRVVVVRALRSTRGGGQGGGAVIFGGVSVFVG